MADFNQPQNGRSTKAIESIAALWFARAVMPMLISLSMAGAGWLLNRSINAVDRIADKMDHLVFKYNSIDSNVSLLNQKLESSNARQDGMIFDMRGELADHETRLRLIEHSPAVNIRGPQ